MTWKKHPVGDSYIWNLEYLDVYLNLKPDGTITLFANTSSGATSMHAAIKFDADMRRSLMAALTTAPETVPTAAPEAPTVDTATGSAPANLPPVEGVTAPPGAEVATPDEGESR